MGGEVINTRERERERVKSLYDKLTKRKTKIKEKTIATLQQEIDTQGKEDIIETRNQQTTVSKTSLQNLTKIFDNELAQQRAKIQEQTKIIESSKNMVAQIINELDTYFRDSTKSCKIKKTSVEKPGKTYTIDINTTKLESIFPTYLSEIYKEQTGKKIKCTQIYSGALNQTLEKFKDITLQYSKKLILALKNSQQNQSLENSQEITKDYNQALILALKNSKTQEKEIQELTINDLRRLERRVRVQDRLTKYKIKTFADVKKVENREILLLESGITTDDVRTYFQIIKGETVHQKDEEGINTKPDQGGKNSRENHTKKSLDDFFKRESIKELRSNFKKTLNRIRPLGYSGEQLEERLKQKEEAIYTAVNNLSREQLNELTSNNDKLLKFSQNNNLWHVDDVQKYIEHLVHEIKEGEKSIFSNSDSNKANLLQQKTQEYLQDLYKNLYDRIKETLKNIPLDYNGLLKDEKKLEEKYQRFYKSPLPKELFKKYLEDKKKEIEIAKKLNALKEGKQTDQITRELVSKQQDLNINEEDLNLRKETRIKNEYQIKNSCDKCAKNIIKQLEELWKYHLKKRKFRQGKFLLGKTYTGTLDAENLTEKLSQQFLEKRKKEGNPKKSQWEQTIERDIADKKRSIGSNEIILQENRGHYIMSLNDIKLMLKITRQGMEVVNILPRKLTIKLPNSNQ